MAKKVVAPKTYKPGKDKPIERLAYLNEREMAYLRSLGGSGKPGPKGIPSFADDSASSKGVSRGGNGAVGSGSTTKSYNSGTSGSKGGGASTQKPGAGGNAGKVSSPSSVSGTGGGSRNPTGGSLSAPARTAPSSGTKTTGQGAQQKGSNPAGANTRGAGSNYGPGSARPGTTSGTGSKDVKVSQGAQVKNAIDTVKNSPAAQRDLSSGGIKTINVGPMGTPVSVGPSVRPSASVQPQNAGIVSISNYAQPKGFSTSFNSQNEANALRDIMQTQTGFGQNPFAKNINETVRHLAGEVGTSGVGAGQVAQTMVNRALVNEYSKELKIPKYTNSLSDPNQWASIGSQAYNAATPGGAVAGRVARQAISEIMSGVPSSTATDFRAINQPGGVKTSKVGIDVAGNRFGNYEGVSQKQMADIRASIPGAAQFDRPTSGPSSDAARLASAASMESTTGVAQPQRAIKSDYGFTTPALAEEAPKGPLMSGPKQIQDRVISAVTPSGDIVSGTVSNTQNSMRKAGMSEAQIAAATNMLMNAPSNVVRDNYNVLSGISVPRISQSAQAAPSRGIASINAPYVGPVVDPRIQYAATKTPPAVVRSTYSGASFDPSREAQKDAIREGLQGSLYQKAVSPDVNPSPELRGPAGTYTAPYDLRGTAGTYTAPYEPRGTAGTYTAPYEPRGPAGTYTAPYEPTPPSREAQGPQRYSAAQPVPQPSSTGFFAPEAPPPDTSSLSKLISSYTANLPSITDINNKILDARKQYEKAHTGLFAGVTGPVADKVLNRVVNDYAAKGISALKGIVESSIIGAVGAQAAATNAGLIPSIDVEGANRAVDTVQKAEGKIYNDRVPGTPESISAMASTGKEFRVYEPTEETAVFSVPSDRVTVAARPGSAKYDAALETYNQAIAEGQNKEAPETPVQAVEAAPQRQPANGLESQGGAEQYTSGIGGYANGLFRSGAGKQEIPSYQPYFAAQTSAKTSAIPTETPSSEARPAIYYSWDMGVNIPSPGDPNYTLYIQYLQEKAAAQSAAGNA